jgi:hypothetical protein
MARIALGVFCVDRGKIVRSGVSTNDDAPPSTHPATPRAARAAEAPSEPETPPSVEGIALAFGELVSSVKVLERTVAASLPPPPESQPRPSVRAMVASKAGKVGIVSAGGFAALVGLVQVLAPLVAPNQMGPLKAVLVACARVVLAATGASCAP